jgi:hypothetical protein
MDIIIQTSFEVLLMHFHNRQPTPPEDGRFTPESDRLLRCRKMTRRAISVVLAPQQLTSFVHPCRFVAGRIIELAQRGIRDADALHNGLNRSFRSESDRMERSARRRSASSGPA